MKTGFTLIKFHEIEATRWSLISVQAAKRDIALLWKFLAPKYLMRCGNIEGGRGRQQITESALRSAEVILLLGSNDLAPARLAAELYRTISGNNPALKIVASGKGGHLTVPGQAFPVTEAEKYTDELKLLGVPAAAIITEKESANSGANMILSQQRLHDIGLMPKRAVIIQSPAAQLRANLVFEKKWLSDWEYYISFPPQKPDIQAMSKEDLGFHLAYALRELATTINYSHNPKYDYQAKITVPRSIIKLIAKYRPGALTGEFFRPENMEQVMADFRERFEKIERLWLDRG